VPSRFVVFRYVIQLCVVQNKCSINRWQCNCSKWPGERTYNVGGTSPQGTGGGECSVLPAALLTAFVEGRP
jgi:hypothetical protein